MLKVHGESMINAGILDGDFVLVEQSAVADNGDIVVALLEDSATVKRFYKEEGIFRLQPENDALEPIIVRDLQIMGKSDRSFPFLLNDIFQKKPQANISKNGFLFYMIYLPGVFNKSSFYILNTNKLLFMILYNSFTSSILFPSFQIRSRL